MDLHFGSVAGDGRGGYWLSGAACRLSLHGGPHTNKIEWWLDSPHWDGGHIGSSIVQEWLGEPVQAFQFNNSNYAEVAVMVAELGRKAIVRFSGGLREALAGLAAAEARINARSRSLRLRDAANDAWTRGDHAAFRRLILELPNGLSAVEKKRLEIVDRRLGPAE